MQTKRCLLGDHRKSYLHMKLVLLTSVHPMSLVICCYVALS